MSAWGLEHRGHVSFLSRPGLPCPAVSRRMKGNRQANPNQISQAGICPPDLDYHTLSSAWRTCDGGEISSHFAFALGVGTAASLFVSSRSKVSSLRGDCASSSESCFIQMQQKKGTKLMGS